LEKLPTQSYGILTPKQDAFNPFETDMSPHQATRHSSSPEPTSPPGFDQPFFSPGANSQTNSLHLQEESPFLENKKLVDPNRPIWLHSKITQGEAGKRLNMGDKGPGSFLVIEITPGVSYTLAVETLTGFEYHAISKSAFGFLLEGADEAAPTFSSLDDVIAYYELLLLEKTGLSLVPICEMDFKF
jgi:hypothetical protein